MSWGYRIAILYLGFVALIMTLVFKSMNQKVDLVSADYYEKELQYQSRIDAINNYNSLSEKVLFNNSDGYIILNFPINSKYEVKNGLVKFYRPSDSSLDVTFLLNINYEGKQIFSVEKFTTGIYNAQVEWESGDKKYFVEHSVDIHK